MKPNQLFTSLLAVTALFVASCSAPRMAQNNAIQDDVYNSTAQAKEYIAQAPQQQYAQTDSVSDSYYGKSDPYYDMDYSSRIDRFYYASPWRSYFNDYYGYNNFYSPYSYSFGLGLGGYFGSYYNNWSNPYFNWGFYGAPYYSNFWGPYSYNYPYYGGGYYGGGYYGGGGYVVRNRNNNPRPVRGSENGVGRANGSYIGGTPSRANNGASGNANTGTRSRAEMYNPTNGTGNTTRPTSDARPSRGTETQSRPSRGNDSPPPSRPVYTPPPVQNTPPPSSSGGGSRGESGGGGGGRPTRGGR